MTALPRDYDSDPERFLSDSRRPHDDVHPYVAARFAAAGARRALDVGGGDGRLARLLPGLAVRCVLLDISPTMLALAPRPAVRADGARLPVAAASVDAVAALYTLYHYDDPRQAIAEARRVLRPGGLFAACAPARDSAPELAPLLPDYGASSTFDAEDAPDIVASVFSAPGDRVEVDGWDGPLRTLAATGDAAGILRCHGLDDEAARRGAASLGLPLTLTMRGCVVYATRG
ncbi:MAG TPA: class I SAM-dependent methyltransferase [Streptosporangiaceae bacterium]|nr:class I SAM-dependent methyltransferase [Streptosporangiaceae bacterium]